MRVVFVHGWGFDARVWDGVRACLTDIETHALDAGYFGAPRLWLDTLGDWPCCIVGHSAGVLDVLGALDFSARPVVSISGFSRFVEGPDFPAGTSSRVLERMRRAFGRAPDTVLTDFRSRCGVSEPWNGVPDAASLQAGLTRLAEGDARDRTAARVNAMIVGEDDPIVPMAMAHDSFPGIEPHIVPQGGHMVPLTHPQFCADVIRGVCNV